MVRKRLLIRALKQLNPILESPMPESLEPDSLRVPKNVDPFDCLDIIPRLSKQLIFIREIDALKEIWRKTILVSGKRVENDAEHSWEMALMAAVLVEYAPPEASLHRIMLMLLIHDLVEIDAGDTFFYDEVAAVGQADREREAAIRIFGLLPEDQAKEFRLLWEEFEARESVDARFARAMDRLQPLLHNFHTGGKSWREYGLTALQVRRKISIIRDGSEGLGNLAEQLIDGAVAQGFLAKS